MSSGEPGCLSLSTPADAPIYLGSGHKLVSAPFSLATLTGCSGDPTLSMASVNVDESAGVAELAVTLIPASDTVVTVKAATVAGTAVAGSDFYGAFENMVFQPGETQKTISISIVEDSEPESSETFSVRLFQNDGAPIGTPLVPIQIVDNDTGVPVVTVTPETVSEADGDVDITVSLSEPASDTITVKVSTKAGSAQGGSDFYGFSKTVTFLAGETQAQVSLTLVNDSVAETTESLQLRLFNATGPVTVGAPLTTITVTDDD